MSRAEEYRPDIDGLRAVAVVLVVLFHATGDLLPGGFIGVDVFFVISGYLITSIILREIHTGTFTLRRFYARRCRRILPALVVVLAATYAIARASLTPLDFSFVSKHVLGGATFTSNILLWRENGYFDIAAIRKPLLHLWSLGVEEQFYLVWPPLAMLAVVRRWRPLWLSAFLLVGSLALAIGVPPAQADAAFYLLPARMWELLVGAVLVQMEWRSEPAGSWRPASAGPIASAAASCVWRELRSVIGVLLIFAVCFFDPGYGRARIAWLVAPVAGAALVISARGAWINRRLLGLRVVVWIGLISYPLYLWHWPLLSIVTLLAGQATMPQLNLLKAGAVALAFVLAALTWWWVELPARRLAAATPARPRRNEQVLVFSACVLIAMGTVGWRTWDRGRAPELDAVAGDEPLLDTASLFPGAGYHRMSAAGSVVLLLGDSHSRHLLPGLVPGARRRGFGVTHIGFAGCPGVPFSVRLWGLESLHEQCQALVRATLSHFLDDPTVKAVVFAARGAMYTVGTASGILDPEAQPLKVPLEMRLQTIYEGYSDTMARVERAGKRFVLVLDIPELTYEPAYCEARLSSAKLMGNQCAMPRQTVDDRQRDFREIVGRLQREHPQLLVFDPLLLLCDSRWCYAKRNGMMMYRDNNHLSGAGSVMVADALGKILFRP